MDQMSFVTMSDLMNEIENEMKQSKPKKKEEVKKEKSIKEETVKPKENIKKEEPKEVVEKEEIKEEVKLKENTKKEEVKEEPKEEEIKDTKEEEVEEELTVEKVKKQEKPKKTASKKKKTTCTSKEVAKEESLGDTLKFNGLLKVVAYGEELFTVNNNETTLEDIRNILVNDYNYSEFKDKKTCTMKLDTQTGIVTPHIEFMKKG